MLIIAEQLVHVLVMGRGSSTRCSRHSQHAGPIYWAIVYVPQGTTPGVLNIDSTAVADMYEPNQFVMNCGIVDPTAGPIRFSSPVSRNLNNGDSIALLLRQTSTNTMGVDGTVRYAITLN